MRTALYQGLDADAEFFTFTEPRGPIRDVKVETGLLELGGHGTWNVNKLIKRMQETRMYFSGVPLEQALQGEKVLALARWDIRTFEETNIEQCGTRRPWVDTFDGWFAISWPGRYIWTGSRPFRALSRRWDRTSFHPADNRFVKIRRTIPKNTVMKVIATHVGGDDGRAGQVRVEWNRWDPGRGMVPTQAYVESESVSKSRDRAMGIGITGKNKYSLESWARRRSGVVAALNIPFAEYAGSSDRAPDGVITKSCRVPPMSEQGIIPKGSYGYVVRITKKRGAMERIIGGVLDSGPGPNSLTVYGLNAPYGGFSGWCREARHRTMRHRNNLFEIDVISIDRSASVSHF